MSAGIAWRSRYDLDCSKLVEVMIEGKCHSYTELFHDDFACAVGKAPTLIIELLKRRPRKRQISSSDFMYFRKAMTEESCAEQ